MHSFFKNKHLKIEDDDYVLGYRNYFGSDAFLDTYRKPSILVTTIGDDVIYTDEFDQIIHLLKCKLSGAIHNGRIMTYHGQKDRKLKKFSVFFTKLINETHALAGKIVIKRYDRPDKILFYTNVQTGAEWSFDKKDGEIHNDIKNQSEKMYVFTTRYVNIEKNFSPPKIDTELYFKHPKTNRDRKAKKTEVEEIQRNAPRAIMRPTSLGSKRVKIQFLKK